MKMQINYGLRLCRQLKGQFVYAGFIDIAGEQYIATIKLDDSAASENAFFKDITIKKRSLYVGQTQDLTPANVIPSADRDITVQQLVEFVKSDFADSPLFTANIPPVKNKKALRASIAPEELVIDVAMPERYTTAEDMKSWLERAVDGKNATEQMSFTRSKLMILM